MSYFFQQIIRCVVVISKITSKIGNDILVAVTVICCGLNRIVTGGASRVDRTKPGSTVDLFKNMMC